MGRSKLALIQRYRGPYTYPQDPITNNSPQLTVAKFQDGVMNRKGDIRETRVPDSGMPESGQVVLSSVVSVPKEAKSLADSPKYKANAMDIFKVHGS